MAVAAYAAVVSLIHVLDQIQHNAHPRLHLDRDRIETLHGKVSFSQEFLEIYSHIKIDEIENLAMQICDVAIEAEDVIDNHVVDQLRALSADKRRRAVSLFNEDIDRVIEKIESINKELMMAKEGMAGQEQQPGVSAPAVSTAPPSIPNGKNAMVGFEEHLVRIMDVLTSTGHKADLEILPIVGMGGIGKTTLAGNVFNDPYIVYHFHVRLWVTISQEYSMDKILLGLLQDMGDLRVQNNKERTEDSAELGELLYKSLSGRRYLIVMDDLWSTEAWNDLMLFFPNNRNGSRILVTTRLSNVAVSLGSDNPYSMEFLDEDQSWSLLCENTFAQEGCPPELEETGRKIAQRCKGLPLAIVVIGGLLSNSVMKREYWEFVAEHVSSFANLENDEHCLKILSLSYNHLPIHLKPCFLHMRVFSEDNEIRVSELKKLWVGEGFIKPIVGKSLEEVAEKYLKELVDRNLILIHEWTHRGKMKTCGIHDLLRDFCLREFQEELFLRVPKMQWTCFAKYKYVCFLCNSRRRCTISLSRVIVASQETTPVSCSVCQICRSTYPRLNAARLLRVMKAVDGLSSIKFRNRLLSKEILHPTKLRCLSLKVQNAFEFIPTLMPLLWNLQTVCIQRIGCEETIVLPSEIWEMPQLRHLIVDDAILPAPIVTQIGRMDSSIILVNLQTLSTILNFRCLKEVLERIPNLRKLSVHYFERGNMGWSDYSLQNLIHLHKLESLCLECSGGCSTLKTVFLPLSLKRLSLKNCEIPWEEMTIIGSLPNLEVLKLYSVFKGPVWNPVEGQFLKLKLLLIEHSHLQCWRAEKVHFPNLESLVLRYMSCLKEIPIGIGEIETLRSIDLSYCKESIVISAKKILEEQENLGIEGLQLHVREMQKVVWKLEAADDNTRVTALKTVSQFAGVESISYDVKNNKLTVIGGVDAVAITRTLRKKFHTDIAFVGPTNEPEPKLEVPKKE